MIKRFLSFIIEQEKQQELSEGNHAGVLIGRFNPVTGGGPAGEKRGHEGHIEAAQKHAAENGIDLHVITTHTTGAKTKKGPNKDPLTPEQKVKHLRRAFPGVNISATNRENPTIFDQIKRLHEKGYRKLTIYGGGDRAPEYEKIKQYHGPNGKDEQHRFDSVTIVNTGERQSGVSGTDMRKHAENNDYESFKKNLPSKIQNNEKHSRELFNDVRKGLGH